MSSESNGQSTDKFATPATDPALIPSRYVKTLPAPPPSPSDPPPPQPPPAPPKLDIRALHARRVEIITHLSDAIALATRRLALAATGESVFANDLDARATVALLRHVPQLLHLLPDKLPPPPPPAPPVPPMGPNGAPAVARTHQGIPICPLCLVGPGEHWYSACPEFPKIKDDAAMVDIVRVLQCSGRVR